MRAKIVMAMVGVLGLAVVVGIAWAQSVPQLINYQGRLTDSSGQPLDGVTVDLIFSFYGQASGGTAYLTVLQEDVQVTDGLYNVLIGSGTITPGTESTLAGVFQNHKDVWMGVKVDTDSEMMPRARITSTAYAFAIEMDAIYAAANADPDHDGDGHNSMLAHGYDCDDQDPSVYPGAPEQMDGRDNQCPGDTGYGEVDEITGGSGSWHYETDFDYPDGWSLKAVDFVTADEGWAVGNYGWPADPLILRYIGDGWTVDLAVSSSPYEYEDISFGSTSEGWAVGYDWNEYDAALFHYSSGSWADVPPPSYSSSDWRLFSVDMISNTDGWAVGSDNTNNKGVVLHYNGASWAPVTTDSVSSSWGLRDVSFTGTDEGWAVGEDFTNNQGALLHYSSGTWTSITPPDPGGTYWTLAGVHFSDSENGWAVGIDMNANEGGLLFQHSSGAWSHVSSPDVGATEWCLHAVHMLSSSWGFAVGEIGSPQTGVILEYSGGSWAKVSPPAVPYDWYLRSISFGSSTEGWSVGYLYDSGGSTKKGVILHYY